MSTEEIEVIAYAGYRDEEEPRFFLFQGKKICVEHIGERWVEEGPDRRRRRFFKVRGREGLYTLCYDEESRGWYLSGSVSPLSPCD